HAARPARAAHLALHAAAAGGAEGDAPPGPRRSAPAVVAARAGLRAVAGAGRSVHRPAGTGPRLLAEPRRGDPAAAEPRPGAATAAAHGPGRAAGQRPDDRGGPQPGAPAAAQRAADAVDLLQPRLPGQPLPAVRHPDHPWLPAAARGAGHGLAGAPGPPVERGAGDCAGAGGGQPGAGVAAAGGKGGGATERENVRELTPRATGPAGPAPALAGERPPSRR